MNYSRFKPLIGADAFNTLTTSHVLVVGCGGVGSFVVEALARSGIGSLSIVDFDIVEPSNINRQLMALHSTLNLRKVDVLKQRILDINPSCEVHTYAMHFNQDTANHICHVPYDFIVDAIDSVTHKIELIEHAINKQIPIISIMGQGNRLDPSALTIKDIHKTTYDRLARAVRLGLRKRRIFDKVPVVISETSAIDVDRNLGFVCSSAFVPSSAGLLAASYVVRQIIGGAS